eukprot:scaffold49877_cov43-Prasinocladus_malaysianus.AAC.1
MAHAQAWAENCLISQGVDTFSSFFDALYYSITTLTSVGFGDIVPQSPVGKAVTTVAVLLYS